MPLLFVRNDITKMDTDAIVNAANSSLREGGGVCGAVFSAAGSREMQKACDAIGHCAVGHAVITPGFALTARYVIHAVGPIWDGGGHGEAVLLYNSYRSALMLAAEKELNSIAFPLISSGIFGYPKKEAFRIAVDAITAFLMEREMTVYLVFFSRDALRLGEKLAGKLESFIDDRFCEQHFREIRQEEKAVHAFQRAEQLHYAPQKPMHLRPEVKNYCVDPMENVSDGCWELHPLSNAAQNEICFPAAETFSEMLLRLIDESGMTDVEVYHRANMDRRLFSKIRSKPDYQPSKSTVLSVAIALRLSLDSTRLLLRSAGYALSDSICFDVIVEFFIREGIFDIYTINEALYNYDQKLLGA